MKKFFTTLTALILCIALLAGCGDSSNSINNNNNNDYNKPAQVTDDLSYVLIYNPNIYNELIQYNPKLNTGELYEYVEAIVNRADGTEMTELPATIPYSTSQVGGTIPESFDLSGNRGETMLIPYKVGDKHEFYCGFEEREIQEFTCKYAGEYCNVWESNNYVDQSCLEKVGKEFDENIYETMTETFGKGRFVDNGGKVNILIYPIDSNGLMGFFNFYDLFATGEVTEKGKNTYGINTDHAIININSLIVNNQFIDSTYATLAHEYQHLLAATRVFDTLYLTKMRTWLNEAMSGYIEEQIYPGTKETSGHYDEFSNSARIRHGQSLYNFETSTALLDFDIGVYGSVYLFGEYLTKVAGNDVFSNIHKYWSTSYSTTLSEAEAIANSVPSSFYNEIDSSFTYNGIYFKDKYEEWLSKLTLNFYISLLNYDINDPDAYQKVVSQTLLYDEINPADIEGGGRVIVALKGNEFEIPSDSDDGLVYIGLNKNFEVTDILN